MNILQDKYKALVQSSEAYAQLKRDVKKGLSHAYLLVSPDRLGLDMLADLFVAEAAGVPDGYRRAAAGTLTDVVTLPETDEKVTVKDVDFLTETAYITPTELDRKFYVIGYGETMNEPAQNKLLKTLEEPPRVTVVIIKTASLTAMLPTVRSRCRVIELKPFGRALNEYAAELYRGDRRLSVALAANRGLISETERLIGGDKYADMYETAVDVLKNMRRSPDAARFSAKVLKYKDDLTDILDYMEQILRDAVCAAAGKPHLCMNAAGVKDAREIAAEYTPDVVIRVMPLIARARRRLQLNGNPTGTVDELLLAMLEVKAKWK